MRDKIGDILLSLLLFVFGVCLLFWSGSVIKMTSIMLGIIFILYGIVSIIRYIKDDPNSVIMLISGIISIIVGVVLLLKPTIISEILSFIIGILIIIICLGSLTNALEFKGSNYRLSIGLSLTGFVIGILCVVGKILIPNMMLEAVGLSLVVFGVVSTINNIITPRV